MNAIIQLQNLSRSFGGNCAINGVSFTVGEGEVFGILGPNGSGKTTLVRLLNGVLAPSSGTATLFNRDVTVDGPYIRARTGVLTETPSLYERFTAKKSSPFSAGCTGFLTPN
jgi:ABC-2 type transport system ATP-binding protein